MIPTKNLIEPKPYMNPTKNLIKPKLYIISSKNLIEPKLYMNPTTNLRVIWVSYLVWSIEMSLTEIQLGPYFLRKFRPFIFLSSKLRWRLRYLSCR